LVDDAGRQFCNRSLTAATNQVTVGTGRGPVGEQSIYRM